MNLIPCMPLPMLLLLVPQYCAALQSELVSLSSHGCDFKSQMTHLPVATGKGNPREQFKHSRIPGSRFFDMDNIADKGSNLPHMLPSEEAFAAAADCLDIGNDTQVVVYDRSGLFSAARVWWTFRVFGHAKVAVLDGGLPLWVSEGHKLEETPVSDDDLNAPLRAAQHPPPQTTYRAHLQRGQVRDLQQVLRNLEQQQEVVVDARGAARFQAKAPEPRPGMRGGHIPGSKNVPFDAVLTGGRLKSPEEIRSAFVSAGVDLEAPLVASCGTGVTASVLALALQQLSPQPKVAVYDGSWSEWGSRQDTPMDTGE
ncbi:hypothetical protein ABBQ38_002269 [Trebouxia sp. C0009 RCD-2024]